MRKRERERDREDSELRREDVEVEFLIPVDDEAVSLRRNLRKMYKRKQSVDLSSCLLAALSLAISQ